MSTGTNPRDAGNWAKPVGRLHVDQVPTGARNVVEGKRLVGPLQGFRSTKGFPFASILKFSPDLKLEFDFGQDKDGGSDTPVDFTGKEPLGKCPKCGGRVFEHGMNYICEHATGKDSQCDFRTGKIILQQEIVPAQVTKLLATGKTDLLDKFISKKTGRAFKAFLALGKQGKVEF